MTQLLDLKNHHRLPTSIPQTSFSPLPTVFCLFVEKPLQSQFQNLVRILQILLTIDRLSQLLKQNNAEDGEQPIGVGLTILRFIGLGAVRFQEKP